MRTYKEKVDSVLLEIYVQTSHLYNMYHGNEDVMSIRHNLIKQLEFIKTLINRAKEYLNDPKQM